MTTIVMITNIYSLNQCLTQYDDFNKCFVSLSHSHGSLWVQMFVLCATKHVNDNTEKCDIEKMLNNWIYFKHFDDL